MAMAPHRYDRQSEALGCQFFEKREWFDPETFLAPERGRGKGGGADAKGEILETFTDPTTGKRMVRRRVKVKHAAG